MWLAGCGGKGEREAEIGTRLLRGIDLSVDLDTDTDTVCFLLLSILLVLR